MKRTLGLKYISHFLICIFLVQQAVSAAPVMEVMPAAETPSFLSIEIPHELANVEEIYEAPPKVDPKLIVHVQNAHGNYSAQVKIAKLMKHLYDTYNFRLFFVEGAVDRIEPDVLRIFPHHAQNMQVADSLARDGKLTGAELFMIDAPADAEAIGVEHAKLYRENYDAFKHVYDFKAETDAYLEEVDMKLNFISTDVFSKELRTILSEWKKFEEGHRDFLPYVKQLEGWAAEFLNVDLRELIAQVAWPQLTRLLMLQSMEEDLDLEAGRAEKEKVITFLRRQGLSEDLQAAVDDLEMRHIRMNRLDPKDRRKENMPRFLIERLMEEAGPKGFDFFDYPEFSVYAGYFTLKSEMDTRALFTEIEVLFDQLLDSLAETSEQKSLLQLYRDYMILKKLFSLDLTRDGWDTLLRREKMIDLERFNQRINEFNQNGTEIKQFDAALAAFKEAKRFYHLARQRESVFYYMVNQGMLTETEAKSILLTGGFHTAGVFEKFREDETNYGILMPRISGEINRDNYISAMLDADHSFFNTQTLEHPLITLKNPEQLGLDPLNSALNDVLATAIARNIEWTRTNEVDEVLSTPSETVGIGFYNYRQFIRAYNQSPAAEARNIQLVPGRDGITGSPVAFVFFRNRIVTRHEHRLAFNTSEIDNIQYAEDGSKIVRSVRVLTGEALFVNPDPSVADTIDEEPLDIITPVTEFQVPDSFIESLEPEPAPRPIEDTDRAIFVSAQSEIGDAFDETSQKIFAGEVFRLLGQLDAVAELERTENSPAERQSFTSLVSTLVSQGYIDAEAGFSEILDVYTRILDLNQSLTPPLEVARQAWQQSNKDFVSDRAGDVIVVTDKLLTEERIRNLGLQLYLNPKLNMKFVFTPPPGDADFINRVDDLRRDVRDQLSELEISISNLTERLQVSVAIGQRQLDKRLRDMKNEIKKQKGRLSEADYVILTENNLRGLLGFVQLEGAVVISSEDLASVVDQTTQLFVVGRAAQDVRADGQFNPTGRYMQAITLKQKDVDTLIGYEYFINQNGLSGLQDVIAGLMQDVVNTTALMRSA